MRFLSVLFAISVAFTVRAVPVVSNVTIQQTEGKKVKVTYDLKDRTHDQLWVSVSFKTGSDSLPAVSLSGDVGLVVTGASRTVYWDLGTDWNGRTTNNVVATVSASVPDRYMIVDLSGTKPVSFLHDRPSGGWGDSYKSSYLVLRRIESGTYKMGSPESEAGRAADETQHQVTITKPFYMGVFQVTVAQWNKFYNPTDEGTFLPKVSVNYSGIRGTDIGSKFPTTKGVDADSFLGKLRIRTGCIFDLPTEAQWEYACRAGTTNAWCQISDNGTTNNALTACAVCDRSGKTGSPVTVGTLNPNAWGLYDTLGNVWEFCRDWYGSYDSSDQEDPIGPTSGDARVSRGGYWATASTYDKTISRDVVRSALRSKTTEGSSKCGFRVACVMPE